MPPRHILIAVMFACVCGLVRSHGLPSFKIMLPGKPMKYAGLGEPMHARAVLKAPAGVLMSPMHKLKPLPIIKTGLLHPILMHKMKKMKRPIRIRPMKRKFKYWKKLKGGRRGGYGRVRVQRPVFQGRPGGYGMQMLGRPGRVLGGVGSLGGWQHSGYIKPMKTYNKGHQMPAQIFPLTTTAGGSMEDKHSEQHNAGFHSAGFQGGNARTLNDIDMFDNVDDQFDRGFEIDDRFDRGFELDDKFDRDFERDDVKSNGLNGINEHLKESLTVPERFDTELGVSQHMRGGGVPTFEQPNIFFDDERKHISTHGALGLNGDRMGNKQSHLPTHTDNWSNPFIGAPNFPQGHTGLNVGGGIGILHNADDRRDDRFDDKSSYMGLQPLPSNINFNGISTFTSSTDIRNDAMSIQHIPIIQHADDGRGFEIETDKARLPDVFSQGNVKFVSQEIDSAKGMDSSGHHHQGKDHIDGLELLGHSHPNMLAGRQLLLDENDNDMHNAHQANIQTVPFNPHSDEGNNIKDSAQDELGEDALKLLGIDPRTFQPNIPTGPFGMQPSFTSQSESTPFAAPQGSIPFITPQGSTPLESHHGSIPFTDQHGTTPFSSPSGSMQFAGQPGPIPFQAQHGSPAIGIKPDSTPFDINQPDPMPTGPFLNVFNTGAFAGTDFHDHATIPQGVPFAPQHQFDDGSAKLSDQTPIQHGVPFAPQHQFDDGRAEHNDFSTIPHRVPFAPPVSSHSMMVASSQASTDGQSLQQTLAPPPPVFPDIPFGTNMFSDFHELGQ